MLSNTITIFFTALDHSWTLKNNMTRRNYKANYKVALKLNSLFIGRYKNFVIFAVFSFSLIHRSNGINEALKIYSPSKSLVSRLTKDTLLYFQKNISITLRDIRISKSENKPQTLGYSNIASHHYRQSVRLEQMPGIMCQLSFQ